MPMGRPAKVKRTSEHDYSSNSKKKRKAPNSPAYAIENDQAVGKTHSTKSVIFVIFFLSTYMYISSSNAVSRSDESIKCFHKFLFALYMPHFYEYNGVICV